MSSGHLQDISSGHLQDMPSRRLQDMPSRRLQEMSLRSLQDMSSRRSSRLLQRNNFSSSKTSSRCLQDVLRDVFKKSSRRLQDVFARCLQDVLEDEKLLRWRRVEEVFKTCLEDTFKASWRPTNVCCDDIKRVKQKQPSRGILRKRCSENRQQIYRRTPTPTSAWVFSSKFAAYFQKTFSQEHLRRAASVKTYFKSFNYLTSIIINGLKTDYILLKKSLGAVLSYIDIILI